MTTEQLSEYAQKLLSALRKLTAEREPHRCDGFTIDDIAWQAGEVFHENDKAYEAMDELLHAGLIRFCGDDDEGCCYALTAKGGVS